MKRTLFWTISAMSLAIAAASLQAKAPGKPGEGFGPHFDLDSEGHGVVSFVSPKGDQCQKFFIEPTQEAIKEKVKVEIVFNPRLVSNQKWEKDKEESIWTGPLDRKTSFVFNHAGHKGVHGGATAKDTHHNWGVRLAGDHNKKYSNVADFEKDWNMFAENTGHTDTPCGGVRETGVTRHTGGDLTYVTLFE